MKLLVITSCVLFVTLIEVQSIPTDFRAVFHTPRKDYDKLEILERSSFDSEAKSESSQPKGAKDQSSYANAQILLRFGNTDDKIEAKPKPQCQCGHCCQCQMNPCVCFNHCPSCYQGNACGCPQCAMGCPHCAQNGQRNETTHASKEEFGCRHCSCPQCVLSCPHCARNVELGAWNSNNTLLKEKPMRLLEINEDSEELKQKKPQSTTARDTRGVSKHEKTTKNKRITNEQIEKDIEKLTNAEGDPSQVSHLHFVTVDVGNDGKIEEVDNQQHLQNALVPHNSVHGSKMMVSYPIFANKPLERDTNNVPEYAVDMLVSPKDSNNNRLPIRSENGNWDPSWDHFNTGTEYKTNIYSLQEPGLMDATGYVLMPPSYE